MHTVNIEIREYVKWSLTRGKKQKKIIKLTGPKSGRGRLLEVIVY